MRINKLNDGITIIALGLILLLCNLGILEWSVWLNLLSLWPLILVVWGLRLIFPRGPLAFISTALIVIGLIAGVTGVLNDGSPARIFQRVNEYASSAPYEEGLKDARLNIVAAAADLKITAIKDMGGAVPRDLYRGFYRVRGFKPIWKSSLTSTSASVRLDIKKERGFYLPKPWLMRGNLIEVDLNPALPWSIDLDTGASKVVMDLTGLDIENLTIDGGATSINITFGDLNGDTRLEVKSGVSAITVKAPRSVGVKILLESAMAAKDIDEDFIKEDRRYTSTNYDKAKGRLNISFSSALSAFEFEWVDQSDSDR